MAGRPAEIKQRDVKAVIIAAKRAGATRVEVPIGKISVIVHLGEGEQKLVEGNEWLGDSDQA